MNVTKKCLAAFGLLLMCVCLSDGQRFYIKPEDRITLPGACLWDCIESVGRTQGHKGVEGIARDRLATGDGIGTHDLAHKELTKRKVPYEILPAGSFDYGKLKVWSKDGAIITVKTKDPTMNHAIVVVEANNKSLSFWNSSAADKVQTGPPEGVKADWRGNIVRLIPPGKSVGHVNVKGRESLTPLQVRRPQLSPSVVPVRPASTYFHTNSVLQPTNRVSPTNGRSR